MAGAFLKGVVNLRERLRRFQKKFPGELARALRIEVEVEAKEVKRRTPVKDGHLRGSVHVEGPFYEGQTLRYNIVAGGVAAPYAVPVHENLEAFHKVGQAKFLESVIFESRPFMAARVARRIDLNRVL